MYFWLMQKLVLVGGSWTWTSWQVQGHTHTQRDTVWTGARHQLKGLMTKTATHILRKNLQKDVEGAIVPKENSAAAVLALYCYNKHFKPGRSKRSVHTEFWSLKLWRDLAHSSLQFSHDENITAEMSEWCEWFSEPTREFTCFQPCKGNLTFKACLQCSLEQGHVVCDGGGFWRLARVGL